ncbi:MAG: hypothetical protein AAF401_14725 [Pseudomonadota bacterium]
MKHLAELIGDLREAPHAKARHIRLAAYFAEGDDTEQGWAAAWLLGQIASPRISAAKLRQLALYKVDQTLFDLSAKALNDVAETAALVWPGSGDLAISDVVQRLDRPADLFDALDAEPRVSLARLYQGRRPKGVRTAEVARALAEPVGADPRLVHGALVQEPPPFQSLFQWLRGQGPAPNWAPPRAPALTAISEHQAPFGAASDYATYALPHGEPVMVEDGLSYTGDGETHKSPSAPDGFAFVSDGSTVSVASLEPLNGVTWDEIRAAGDVLLQNSAGEWFVWEAPSVRLMLPVTFVEIGRGVSVTLGVLVDGELAPLAKLAVDHPSVATFARRNTVDKFGPVRQVAPGMSAEIAFRGAVPAKRRKTGVVLVGARIISVIEQATEPPLLEQALGRLAPR